LNLTVVPRGDCCWPKAAAVVPNVDAVWPPNAIPEDPKRPELVCWLVAGWLVAGWLEAGWLVAGWLVAGWLVAGWLVAGLLVVVPKTFPLDVTDGTPKGLSSAEAPKL
jgi:hypothetical protein